MFHRYPDAPPARRFWYVRFWAPDPKRPGHTKEFLWSTKQILKPQAEKLARAHIAEVRAGRIGGTTRAKAETTLEDLRPLYLQHATCKPDTAARNWQCLANILRRVNLQPSTCPLQLLTPELLRRWRTAATDHAEHIAGADDIELARALRGQNSILNQARSVFAPRLREFYEEAGHTLPPLLLDFLTRPGVDAPDKDDYQKPDDLTLVRTFQSLDENLTADRNLYVAVWLALGFGLRKSEVAAARACHFVRVAGRIHCRLNFETKNGASTTDIPVHNGAWERLEPQLAGLAPDAYLLTGEATERFDHTFRRISEWMRALGWATQKTFHEFRAYAGCSVAESHGLEYASPWLRHSNLQTTQRYYGRYLKSRPKADAPLALPALPAHDAHPVSNPVSA